MSDAKTPHTTPRAVADAAARKAREAAALRENLRRRKAQARLRADDRAPEPDKAGASGDDIG
jgi:hypothetical protein